MCWTARYGTRYRKIINNENTIKIMKIQLKGDWQTRRVWLNGKELFPEKSQKVINHSPDGFNWGYGGSGPAQLALAICLELGFKMHYQDFKWKYIATLPKSDFDVEIEIDQ